MTKKLNKMMKILSTILLLLLSTFAFSQQEIEMCDDNRMSFIYMSSSDQDGQFYWYIDGSQEQNSSNHIQIDWRNYSLGVHVIEVEFISDLNCESQLLTYNINLVECKESMVFIPNAFTPDRDGINDIWQPVGFNVKSIFFTIFNRWGQELFTSNNGLGWDGKYKGEDCMMDVYVFIIKWVDKYDQEHIDYGKITLLK